MKSLFIIAIAIYSIAFSSFSAQSALSYKDFGVLPMFEKPSVSPDGNKIVAIFNTDDGPSVVLSDFGGQEISTLVKLKKAKDRIDDVYWINEKRVLVSASYSERIVDRYFRMTRLFAIDIDGQNLREIKQRGKRDLNDWEKIAAGDVSLVSLLKNDKEHILVQLYDKRDKDHAVFKFNVNDGSLEKLFANTYNVHSWVVNSEGVVVFGYGTDKIERDVRTIWYRKDASSKWNLLHKKKAYQGETFRPIIVQDNKLLVISDRETRRASLWQYDIEKGEFDSIIYSHDKYDIEGVIYSADRDRVLGVYYFDNFRRSHYIEDADNNIATLVKNTFKNFETSIYSLSQNKQRMLILAASDNSPSKFLWMDLNVKKAGIWFTQYPYLEKKNFPNVTPYNYKAKDGTELSGYLTLPHNASPEKTPVVVWPHGGPIGVRDYQYFDTFVQFFVSKGYAVLQMNYRGSGGFGSDFEVSGFREWGKLMQEDVYDAFDWLKAQKLVNTDNACLAGYSYGGYVALTASFQKPNTFKCIISVAGVSDLLELAEDDYRWEGSLRAHVINEIGDPSKSEVAKELASVSAINHLDKIKAPILLLHGTYDTQVRLDQSSSFYDKAKKAGVDVEYTEYKYGTHYLDEPANRMDAFKKIGEFLEEHLD